MYKECAVDIEFDLVDKSQICLITVVHVVLSLYILKCRWV